MAAQKTIVLTGASSGLGAIAARELAKDGWQVAVVGRNPERTNAVAQAVGGTAFLADYDRLDDVRALAAAILERYPVIDVLANNAGGLVSRRGTTADGNERTFQHNHLAPFLLTNLLLERLSRSTARVINTASSANEIGHVNLADLNSRRRPYLGGWRAYGTAKLETIMFTRELARRTPLTAYSFHPGFVATSFASDSVGGRALMRLTNAMQLSPDAGAAPLVELAEREAIDVPNGTYFDGLKPLGRARAQANNEKLASDLWEASLTLTGLA
ncbi:MAG TPA: SDR family NAD(P)-dependent oxidoreductase [Galbitalea sp.]|jgi:NAD(P)-dependent dehydrogenase (short-subunit alcohol dehydrogenase family)|nr:SDR family NAD(P)-dependent oxidoreductase [Galbitalea sp.]